ncbi:GGDEF domain-containing protein [Fervidobacterium sp.]
MSWVGILHGILTTIFGVLVAYFLTRIWDERIEKVRVKELLLSLGLVVDGNKLGLAIWTNSEFLYLNNTIITHALMFNVDMRKTQELMTILEEPDRLPILFDIVSWIKKTREEGKDCENIWRKEVDGKCLEIRYLMKVVNGKKYEAVTTRDISFETSQMETQILRELSNIVEEEMLGESADLYNIGEKIRKILYGYNISDSFGIGLLRQNGELYFPYFKILESDDRSGMILKRDEKTFCRYVVDKGIKLYVKNSVTDEDLGEGYKVRRMRDEVRSVYGVPIIFHGLTRGVILFEKQGENQFSNTTLSVFDKIAQFISLSLRFIDILEELEDEKKKLFEISIKDYLTGAYSRLFLEQFLEKELSKCKRTNDETTVVFLDVNEFKKINDVYGHVYGDKVLKTLVEVVNKNIRLMDVVARYGGDEFVIVLPETEPESAQVVIERIVKALKEMNISISYGALEISEYSSIEDLYKEVDKRMYEMKSRKREQRRLINKINEDGI